MDHHHNAENSNSTSAALKAKAEWVRPQVQRIAAGSAEATSNTVTDGGFGKS